ncbi:MAG: LuxR C-terminal-related transcriptional regulator [Spirochaetaceae bacterium]|nr:LuxR C-terminal-related transcriptional regulator [Spirochaetaceae bacterium]
MSSTISEARLCIDARLSVPRLRSDRVRRPRLLEKLERAGESRLIFIQAPAGFGKTTLIADWLASTRRPFAWLGVDREESDADVFLSRLQAAVEAALGETEAPLAASSRDAHLYAIASRIVETAAPFVLVIDDFHNLRNTEGQGSVARLCELLPQGACLAIASREGIPFPAARLRAKDELLEIGTDALRFTLAESREFLTRTASARLSDEFADLLGERTEGWIAALQLAVIALRDGRDPRRFVEAFGGRSRAVYDFLAEEALDALPRTDLDFLAAVSVVERFCAPLCAALTGASDIPTRLMRLERDCLFLVPLDDDRSWYRFHHLFREALLGRLRACEPERERALRLAASAWLEENGHQADALRQAVLAGDAARAGVLAEDYALAALERGEVSELREGFGAFGRDRAGAGPWLRIAEGWVEAYSGDLVAALAHAHAAEALSPEASILLAAAREGLEERFRTSTGVEQLKDEDLAAVKDRAALAAVGVPDPVRHLAGQIETLRAYITWLQAECHVSLDRATRALELLPPGAFVGRSHAETTVGCSLYMLARDSQAAEVLTRAMETAQRAGVRHVRYLAASSLANIRLALGDLDGAKALCLRMASEPGAERFPALGDVFVILSTCEWERDEIGAALAAGRRGLELCRRWGQADRLVAAYIALAAALTAAGEAQEALDLLAGASRLEAVSFWHKLNLDEAIASIEIERGNRAGADAFCSRPQPIKTYEGYFTLAHWLILRHRGAEAFPYIDYYRERGEKRGTLPRLADAYLLHALVAKSRGDRAEALAWLDKALATASSPGCVRRFVRRGEGIAELLAERLAEAPDNFVERILEAFEADAERRVEKARIRRAEGGSKSDAAVETLSPRELEILRFLGEGRTAEEIAARAFVAPSTVRSHIKAIYGKLGVHRRVEAIRRASELRLL